MKRTTQGWGGLAFGVMLGWLAVGPSAFGEDVTTLSGRTYRQVRLVRVDTDGVVWQHASGMCKVDFTDLPKVLRQRYHDNAAQACAYQTAQAQARQQAAAQARQDQQKAAAWRAQRLQQTQEAEAARTDVRPGTFVYHRDRVPVKAAEALGAQIDARKVALAKLTEDDGTIYDRRLWAIPRFIVGLSSDGHAFDAPDVKSPEYQRSLRRAPADKASYEDVDRAAAFARGQP